MSSGRADADPAGRLDTLEFKLAHLERAVQELSDVVYRQQQELDRVLEVNRQLRQQVEDLETRASAGGVETPPHY